MITLTIEKAKLKSVCLFVALVSVGTYLCEELSRLLPPAETDISSGITVVNAWPAVLTTSVWVGWFLLSSAVCLLWYYLMKAEDGAVCSPESQRRTE